MNRKKLKQLKSIPISLIRPVRRITTLISISLVFLLVSSYLLYSSFKEENAVKILGGINIQNSDKIKLENEIREITRGYPIDTMVPYIIEKDTKVAAYLVSIAKKESNLGKRSPKLHGQDCYNYWGYREVRKRMGTGGHTCFDNPEDAVDTVAARVEELLAQNIDTPSEMIIWKCGFSCKGHSSASVKKWISDINHFFKKIYTSENSQ